MARYVILDAQNRIVNRCEWDGVSSWQPAAGCTAMLESAAIAKGYSDAPQMAAARIITPRQFMDRLPMAAQLAIVEARKTSAQIDLLLLRLTAGDVDLDYPETVAGVAAMKSAGLITAEQAQALLA